MLSLTRLLRGLLGEKNKGTVVCSSSSASQPLPVGSRGGLPTEGSSCLSAVFFRGSGNGTQFDENDLSADSGYVDASEAAGRIAHQQHEPRLSHNVATKGGESFKERQLQLNAYKKTLSLGSRVVRKGAAAFRHAADAKPPMQRDLMFQNNCSSNIFSKNVPIQERATCPPAPTNSQRPPPTMQGPERERHTFPRTKATEALIPRENTTEQKGYVDCIPPGSGSERHSACTVAASIGKMLSGAATASPPPFIASLERQNQQLPQPSLSSSPQPHQHQHHPTAMEAAATHAADTTTTTAAAAETFSPFAPVQDSKTSPIQCRNPHQTSTDKQQQQAQRGKQPQQQLPIPPTPPPPQQQQQERELAPGQPPYANLLSRQQQQPLRIQQQLNVGNNRQQHCQQQQQQQPKVQDAALEQGIGMGGMTETVDGLLFLAADAPPSLLPPDGVWSARSYRIVSELHKGYASSVYRATCRRTGAEVVLKAYHLGGLSDFLLYQVLRELDIHSRLHHEGVVQLLAAFKEGDNLVMVLEYAGGGSACRVRRKLGGRMTEFQAMHLVLLPLLGVLSYLHERGIVHRDIKPENLLFTESWQLKLCDFGVSICLREERAVTRTGSREYMAPEVNVCPLKHLPEDNKDNLELSYTSAVDVWSLGSLMYELLVGFTPFPGGPPPRKEAAKGSAGAALAFPSGVSQPARQFVRDCLQLDPADRPTVHQLLEHSWVREALADAALGSESILLEAEERRREKAAEKILRAARS